MLNPTTLKRHAGLMDDMAQTLGLDLEELALRGQLSISDIDDAVLRCTGCTRPGACERWLATDGARAEAPPHYCRNTEIFAELKAVRD